MRYNDETKFHDLFNDSDVLAIFENEIPGFIFYIFESPLWNLTLEQTFGYVKNIYSTVPNIDAQKMERIFKCIEKLT